MGVTSSGRSKTIKYTQDISFSQIRIQEVFDYIALVKAANSSIHLGRLNLHPSRSRGGGEETWDVKLEFYLFQNDEVLKQFQKKIKKKKKVDSEEEMEEE